MGKPRRRKAPRTTRLTGNRYSLYFPDDELEWANHWMDYVITDRGLSGSHTIRRLMMAWMLNEEESGKKKKKWEGNDGTGR